MDSIASNLTDIKTIVAQEYEFNIPIYQRLYVWTEEQVKTLFEDLHTAYKADKDLYYIGGIITVNNEQSEKSVENTVEANNSKDAVKEAAYAMGYTVPSFVNLI